MHLMKLYTLALLIFLALDAIWLGWVAKDLYQNSLAHLLGPVKWSAAVIFYFIFVLGIVFFCIEPTLKYDQLFYPLIQGAFFGFVCYATYDLTNLATLRNWPLSIVIYDLLWGAFITSFTTTATWWIAKVYNL